MQKKSCTAGGFTLIELLVVVLIIGILAAIALPQYQLAVEKSRAAEAWVTLRAIYQAAQVCRLEGDEYCNFLDIELEISGLEKYDDGTGATKGYFEYVCDAPDCSEPYAGPLNRNAFDYWLMYRDVLYDDKRTCYGDNAQGQRLCRALGGKELEVDGNRIVYEF